MAIRGDAPSGALMKMRTRIADRRVARARVAFVLMALVVLAGCGTPEDAAGPPSTEPYVLFAPIQSNAVYLMDLQGQLVHQWRAASTPACSVYLLTNGLLLRARSLGDTNFPSGGCNGGRIELLDWDGRVTWTYDYNGVDHQQHHDVRMMPNGHVLMIAWEKRTGEEALAPGQAAVLRRPQRPGEREGPPGGGQDLGLQQGSPPLPSVFDGRPDRSAGPAQRALRLRPPGGFPADRPGLAMDREPARKRVRGHHLRRPAPHEREHPGVRRPGRTLLRGHHGRRHGLVVRRDRHGGSQRRAGVPGDALRGRLPRPLRPDPATTRPPSHRAAAGGSGGAGPGRLKRSFFGASGAARDGARDRDPTRLLFLP